MRNAASVLAFEQLPPTFGRSFILGGGVPYDLTPGHPVGTIHTILIEEKESVLP